MAINAEAEPIYSINGHLVRKSQATIPVTDIAVLRGLAVFDFWITYPHHRSLNLDHQLDRLRISSTLVGLTFPWTNALLSNEVQQALEANNTSTEKAIRYVVTGGSGPDSITPAEIPNRILYIEPHQPYSAELYENGAAIITHKFTRYIPGAKSTNYIEAVKQTQIARSQGAIEVVYYSDGQLYEGATSNVFIVKDRRILTPNSDILPGITRKFLLQNLDLPITESSVAVSDLRSADEVFLAASNKQIMPITKIDGQPVGDGNVGSITKNVMRQFDQFTRK